MISMGFLLGVLIVLGVPFGIGYLVGKNSSSSKSDHDARIKGQREVRDYLVSFLATQPAKISKTILLKEMGINSEAEEYQSTVITQKVKMSEKSASWSPFADTDAPVKSKQLQANLSTNKIDTSEYVEVKPSKSKEERDLQNINTILYVASFLLVAAAVLFIGAAVDNSLKFIGAWVVTIGFYVSGMLLHSMSRRLQPAAVAFIGTGLALLPFAGIAANIFVLHDPVLSWFSTSLLGLILFVFATLRLQNQVLAYLTLGFVFSLTTSSVSVLRMGFVWYFVLIIIVASVLNIVAFFWPKLLPKVFLRPIDDSGQIAVPLAVLGSWWSHSEIQLWQNALVLAITSLHYAVAALAPKKLEYRSLYIFLSRLAVSISIVLFAYDLSEKDLVITGIVLTIVASLQIVASLLVIKKRFSSDELYWLWGGLMTQLIAIGFWHSAGDVKPVLVASSLVLALVSSVSVAYLVKRSRFAYVGIFTVVILPFQIGYSLTTPSWPNEFIAGIFSVAAIVLLALRYLWARTGGKKEVAMVGYCIFIAVIVVLSTTLSAEWSAVFMILASFLVVAVSYVEKVVNIQVLANALFLVGIYIVAGLFDFDSTQRWLVTAWVGAAIFYAARIFLPLRKEQDRAQIMGVYSVLSLIVVGILVIMGSSHTIAAAATLIASAILLIFEARVYKQHEYYEISVLLVTLALQRVFSHYYNADSLMLYSTWWGVTLYGLSLLRHYIKDMQAARFWSVISLLVLLFAGFFSTFDPNQIWWSTLSLALGGGVLIVEGWFAKRHEYYEIAVLVLTFAFQRVVAHNVNADILLYSAWWGITFYALAWLRRYITDQKNALMWSYISLAVFLSVGFLTVFDQDRVVWSAVNLLIGAVILAVEGWVNKRHAFYEAGIIVATFALQRMVAQAGDYDLLIYSHWWAVTLATLAGLRYFIKDKESAKQWLIASLVTLSIPTGLKALSDPGGYQLVFLVEHVALLALGGLLSYRLAILWGAGGIALAVLYWLQGYTYLLVGLIGFGLLGLAVWRLMQKKT